MTRGSPGYWNIWWTLTVLAMVFTFVVVILESVGALRDFGIVLSVFGLLVGIVFGLTAWTRSSVTLLGTQIRGVADEMRTVTDEIRGVRRILEERLPRLS